MYCKLKPDKLKNKFIKRLIIYMQNNKIQMKCCIKEQLMICVNLEQPIIIYLIQIMIKIKANQSPLMVILKVVHKYLCYIVPLVIPLNYSRNYIDLTSIFNLPLVLLLLKYMIVQLDPIETIWKTTLWNYSNLKYSGIHIIYINGQPIPKLWSKVLNACKE